VRQHFDYEEPLSYPAAGSDPAKAIALFVEKELGLKAEVIRQRQPGTTPQATIQLSLGTGKTVREATTYELQQLYRGVRVWGAGISVTLDAQNAIRGASVTYDEEVAKEKIKLLDEPAAGRKIDARLIATQLDFKRNKLRVKRLRVDPDSFEPEVGITRVSGVIYRYREADRQDPHAKPRKPKPASDEGHIPDRIFSGLPQLRLPAVDKSIREGAYYHAAEVLFSTSVPWGTVNWRMVMDLGTYSVLYLRVLADQVTAGFVYDDDPTSVTGDATILPSSPVSVLNGVRAPRPLPGLGGATLSGSFVELAELSFPPSTFPASAGNFDFNVNTEDFSAVNAYYHNDAVFRMVEEMGFDISTYFDGTTFPVPVDHRGFCDCVNACAPGNAAGNGSGGFHYGLVQAGQMVGIATSKRIVLHEFGHAVLWDHVDSPNLGFCHSVGDSLAAVLCDPRSIAPDRFATFPWLTLANPGIDRRHDRPVGGGWAWRGVNDDGGYGSEQILSTSHFRLYLALGGASKRLCDREFASRYTAYLILYAVGLLTPATNSPTPEDWTARLMQADRLTTSFEGQPGHCIHKVARWAFEKQGAFPNPMAPLPITGPGQPPDIDVFIDDGRNGEYDYATDLYHGTATWNRLEPDNGALHQEPKCGVVNHAYVAVRNRGLQTARRVVVRGFHSVKSCCCGDKPGEMIWPTDFLQMETQFALVDAIEPGSYAIAGPFKWRPCSKRDSLVFYASTRGDLANAERLPADQQVPVDRIVPFDNNMSLRASCAETCCC
jgi:hypothetical protein